LNLTGWCGAGGDHYEPLIASTLPFISPEKAAIVLWGFIVCLWKKFISDFFLSRNWRPVFLLCQFILLTDLLPIYHGPIWTYTYTNPCRAIYLFLESYSIWDMNCSEHIHNRFLVCFHVLWNNQKLDGRLIASVFIDNFVYCGINLPVYLLLLKSLLSAD